MTFSFFSLLLWLFLSFLSLDDFSFFLPLFDFSQDGEAFYLTCTLVLKDGEGVAAKKAWVMSEFQRLDFSVTPLKTEPLFFDSKRLKIDPSSWNPLSQWPRPLTRASD